MESKRKAKKNKLDIAAILLTILQLVITVLFYKLYKYAIPEHKLFYVLALMLVNFSISRLFLILSKMRRSVGFKETDNE